MQNYIRKKPGKPGFTLIEVIIAVTISGIVAGGIFSVLYTCLSSWDTYAKRTELLLYGKLALDRVGRDIRESLEILEIGNNYVNFRGGDNGIYRYDVQDGVLYKRSNSANMPLLENVTAFNLSSRDGFITVSLNMQVQHIPFAYRTGAARRVISGG